MILLILYIIMLFTGENFDIADVLLLVVAILYLSFTFLLSLLKRVKIGVGVQIWQVVLFIKYYLMPLYIVYSEERFTIGVATYENTFLSGCMLLVYEMLWVYGLSFYYFIKNDKKKLCVNYKLSLPRNMTFLLTFTVVSGLICLVLFPESIIPAKAFEIINSEHSDTVVASSISNVVFGFWKDWSFIIFAAAIIKYYKSSNHNDKKYTLYVFLLLLIYLILNFSASRWSLLFLSLNAFYIFNLVFGRKIRGKILVISGVLSVLIILITIYKFSWYFNTSDGTMIDLLAGQLQSYFSGPNLLAQTIQLNEQSWFSDQLSIRTFFNDVLGTFPIISNYINQNDRINFYFCSYIFGSENITQIIPMTGVGYSYFGPILSPFITVVFTYIGLRFDRKSIQSPDLVKKYFYNFSSFWFLLSIIFNTQIVIGNFVVNCLPIFLLYKLFSFNYGRKKSQSVYTGSCLQC